MGFFEDIGNAFKGVTDFVTAPFQKGGIGSNIYETVKKDIPVVSILDAGYNMFTGERSRNDALATQQKQYEREDTAFQRMVADKQAAGLHPLAGVSGSSSSPVNIPKSGEMDITSKMVAMLNAKQAQANIAKTEAETRAIEATTPKTVERMSAEISRLYTELNGYKEMLPALIKQAKENAVTAEQEKYIREIEKRVKQAEGELAILRAKKSSSPTGQSVENAKITLGVIGELTNTLNPFAILGAGKMMNKNQGSVTVTTKKGGVTRSETTPK